MMSKRVTQFAAGLTMALVCGWSGMVSLRAQQAPQFAGATDRGFVLPNAWVLNPAGEQILLADLPLNIIPQADNRHVLAATSGYNTHELTLIDLASRTIVDRQAVQQSWFGLATSPGGRQIWWSGGGGDLLHTFQLEDLHLKRTSGAEPPRRREGRDGPRHFRSGIALDPHRHVIYSLDVDGGTVSILDPKTLKPIKSAPAGKRPYDIAVARNGTRLFVSDWAERAIRVLEPGELRRVASIGVGEHPNQIAVHPQDDRIFVACASSDCVSVIDTRRGIVTETIHTALFPRAPEGSTPDALAVAPDGKTLYVANADNNCVAVIDIAAPGRSQVKGFIPTGWYPTAVAVTPDGKNLLVGVGKGNQTKPNPIDRPKAPAKPAGSPAETYRSRIYPYIGTTLSGALSIVPIPDEKELARFTETVYRNCPYSDKLLTVAHHPEKTAIPTKVGEPSPIKHVLYIIKENRTYDQVFGDMSRGNGDPSLVMFGREVTPNHHKLAEDFVLLDNLYCNGHVSADGHPWSTMAYNTDFIARNWALTYSSRAGIHDDDDGDLSNAPSGYLWDACASRPALPELRRIWAAGQRARWLDANGGSGPGLGGAHVPGLRRLQGPWRPRPRHPQR